VTKKTQRLIFTIALLVGGGWLAYTYRAQIGAFFARLTGGGESPPPTTPPSDQTFFEWLASLFGGGGEEPPPSQDATFWEWVASLFGGGAEGDLPPDGWKTIFDLISQQGNQQLSPEEIQALLEEIIGENFPPGVTPPGSLPWEEVVSELAQASAAGQAASAFTGAAASTAAVQSSNWLVVNQLRQLAAQGPAAIAQAAAQATVPLVIGLDPRVPKAVGNVSRTIETSLLGRGPKASLSPIDSDFGYIEVTRNADGFTYWKGTGSKAGMCFDRRGREIDCP